MKVKILDNFLKKEHLQIIQNIELEKIDNKSVKVYHHAIDFVNNIISNDLFNNNFLNDLQKTYHNKALELLRELYPEKIELYDYSDFHLIESGKDYKFPIHDDLPEKLLSGVIYISPRKIQGLYFMTKKTEMEKMKSNGKSTEQFFFQEKNVRVGIHIKVIRKTIG